MNSRCRFFSVHGSSGVVVAEPRMVGITGHFRSMNWLRNARISSFCQGPIPLLPTKTAADFMLLICSPSSVCQELPGGTCSMSSHGLMPSLTNCCAMWRTACLSSPLWHRNTSNSSAVESSSSAFTRSGLYRETRAEDKPTSSPSHLNGPHLSLIPIDVHYGCGCLRICAT
jgi:hypothetical protein